MGNEDMEEPLIQPDEAMELRGISMCIMLQMSIPFSGNHKIINQEGAENI